LKRSLLLLGRALGDLPNLLRSVFEHPWVGSFQVGFGPPLVRSSPQLMATLEQAGSALEKLDAYLGHCVVDEEAAARLSALHRKQLVQRHGPIEAEALDKAATDAIDLSFKLKGAESEGRPGLGEARIVLRLDDPSGARWFQSPEVAERLQQASDQDLVVEVRVDAAGYADWARWGEDWSARTGHPTIADVELIPHAIVSWESPPS
jgi:hypothetical protein